MKKLKSIDFKALFINHGEKFGFGLIGLFVLLALSSTSWSRTSKSPEELKAKIAAADDKIKSPQNTWPAAKAEKFAIVNFNGQAQEVFAGVATTRYEFTTPMFWPLYRKKEKAREPEFSVPIYLIADGGLAVLGISTLPTGMEMTDAATDPATAQANEALSSNLKPAPGGATTGAGPASGPGGGHGATTAPFGIPTATPARPPGGRGAGPGSKPPSPSSSHGPAAMPAGPGGMPTSMGSVAGGITARGKRYVAIRAIVPIKEQIDRAMKALNMSPAEASAAIEYTDFTLQRQTAVAGSDPWTGEWETVQLESALEALRDSTDFDPDPVPSELQDAVFTMPLPYRLLRYWGDHATHPHIKQFRLSEEEMQRELKLQAKLVEEAEKMNLQTKPKIERHGLVSAVNDVRQIARSVMSSQEGNNTMMGMASYMNEGGSKMAVPDIKSRLTASGRLYLFRYFDFDVQPGMAYRYRLKLQLKNPNFERPYEEVENESLVKGPYRETGWSNISNPTVVPDTIHYFLKDVERDPTRDDKHSKKPVASIAMFEWDAKLGTMLSDTLKILNIGQFIAEKKKTMVLDPGTPTFEEKEIQFATDDVLLDASGDLDILADQHPDLQLKPDRGRNAKVGMLPEALVATSYGTLKELDPISESRDERDLKQGVEEERKNFQYLKDAPKENTSILDGGAYPGGTMGTMAAGAPGRGNPRKRTPGGGGASMYGSGPGAGPGMGPGMGPGSSPAPGRRPPRGS